MGDDAEEMTLDDLRAKTHCDESRRRPLSAAAEGLEISGAIASEAVDCQPVSIS